MYVSHGSTSLNSHAAVRYYKSLVLFTRVLKKAKRRFCFVNSSKPEAVHLIETAMIQLNYKKKSLNEQLIFFASKIVDS